MFLNKLGIPIVRATKDELISDNIEDELAHAPLLLNDSASLMQCKLPSQWNGCLYTHQTILKQIKDLFDLELKELVNTCELIENVPTKITLNSADAISEEDTLEVTLIPILTDSFTEVMFLLKDKYTTRLLTDRLSNCFDVFLYNRPLREAIIQGVDVLYIDDTVFLDEEDQALPVDIVYPSKFQLLSLIYLVRPKEIVGTAGSRLPPCVQGLCQKVDLYSDGGLSFSIPDIF